MTRIFQPSLALAGSLLLASCAIPGEETAATPDPAAAPAETEQPAATAQTPAVPEEAVFVEPPVSPATANHGLRLPPMLNLPGDGDFRATNPAVQRPADGGPIISRPPTDPPPRPRPQQAPPETDEEKLE